MIENITLEMSLKPFFRTDDEYIEKVCNNVFDDWKPLCRDAKCVSILFWSADGSELLDYRGNADDEFEWAYFIGGANQREASHADIDPEGKCLHSRHYLYRSNPAKMTYAILKKIVAAIKKTGKAYFPDKKIRVGTTFDPGPEFAISDFKYKRHNEICMGNDMGHATMVCAYAKFHKDDVKYASYPNGIPEGTPFGEFFGRQANAFMTDMGFDYIWFSNGLGFGREPWSTTGALFDGKKFNVEKLAEIKKDSLDFWRLFRQGCPDYPIETRGTNMSMGIDLATDGVPLSDVYNGDFGILPPPNSPWAAINGDFGLELAGYMSHIAKVPNKEYLFRYYLHDPWWDNSPWYDRYNSQPHDIYLPLACARIDEDGKVQSPTHMNILTIDNSFGKMPYSCVVEPLPHMLRAFASLPDAVSPFVWVYPFDEYSDCRTEEDAKRMFFEDWYIRGAINHGLPLSCVISTDNFVKTNKKIYSSSIIVTTVPNADSAFEKAAIDYANAGGRIIFIGNVENASERFLDLIGVSKTTEKDGIFDITVDGERNGKLCHQNLICGGGINTVEKRPCGFAFADSYCIATQNKNVIWLRGTSANNIIEGEQLIIPQDPKKFYNAEKLMINAISKLGFEYCYKSVKDEPTPVMMLHRHDNAYIFSVFSPSTTVETTMRFPFGAPILDSYEAEMRDGRAVYRFPKADRRECRVFVEQKEGVVSCRELSPVSCEYRRRVQVSGLKNATVRFIAEKYCENDIYAVLNGPAISLAISDEFDGGYVKYGNDTFYEMRNVTGTAVFSMPYRNGSYLE